MDTEELVHNELQSIWNKKVFSKFCTRSFIFPKTIVDNSILFIGINPGYKESDEGVPFYELQQKGNKLPYFRKFEELSADSGIPWTHLDLLFFRETNQDHIYDILRQEHGIQFVWEQLNLSDKLIKSANVKIIVVCNALAGTFLGKEKVVSEKINVWLDYNFVFDDSIGTYKWNNIPVFFSGMLSGQRALDKGSYERLKWHIRKVLN